MFPCVFQSPSDRGAARGVRRYFRYLPPVRFQSPSDRGAARGRRASRYTPGCGMDFSPLLIGEPRAAPQQTAPGVVLISISVPF